MQNNIEFGRVAENKVLQEYQTEGYALVAKNFEYYAKGSQGRTGEIDLILSKGTTLVLVEVKARKNMKFGDAREQITKTKIQNIKRAYNYFIRKNPNYQKYYVRLDAAFWLPDNTIQILANSIILD